MSEQADSALDSGSDINDLAAFLEQPEEDSSDEQEVNAADETTLDEDTVEEADDGQDDVEDSEEEVDEPAPDEKITLKVKGEDGKEEVIEVTHDEVAKSYMRQQDYTRKTQELAQRENQAVQFLAQKHEEIRSQYLQQAEVQRAAIIAMAGIKSDAEMDQLAASDPAAWVSENQRQKRIGDYLSQLDQQINGEKQLAQQQAQEQMEYQRKQAFQTAWSELSKDGIDRPKLQKIYADAMKSYGFTAQELGNVYDHRMVRVLKDAAELRELKSRKAEVVKKVTDAPRMPSKQPRNPAQTRRSQELERKFSSGRAKLNDLAALLR